MHGVALASSLGINFRHCAVLFVQYVGSSGKVHWEVVAVYGLPIENGSWRFGLVEPGVGVFTGHSLCEPWRLLRAYDSPLSPRFGGLRKSGQVGCRGTKGHRRCCCKERTEREPGTGRAGFLHSFPKAPFSSPRLSGEIF